MTFIVHLLVLNQKLLTKLIIILFLFMDRLPSLLYRALCRYTITYTCF